MPSKDKYIIKLEKQLAVAKTMAMLFDVRARSMHREAQTASRKAAELWQEIEVEKAELARWSRQHPQTSGIPFIKSLKPPGMSSSSNLMRLYQGDRTPWIIH